MNFRDLAGGELGYLNNIYENIDVTLADFVQDEKVKIGECYPFEGEY